MKPVISICLCCWNDLPYLKILFGSILKNTSVPYEICVYDNGSIDGTQEWLQKQLNIKYILGDKNLGTTAVNKAIQMAVGRNILWINSDMYLLPGYDKELTKTVDKYKGSVLVCPYIIEPQGFYGKVSKTIVHDSGDTHKNFNETDLLKFYDTVKNKSYVDIYDYTHPVCLTKETWDRIEGLDEDYFPGWAVDCQFTYDAFCLGIKPIKTGKAFVYHFVSKTLKGTCFSEEESAKMCSDGLKLFNQKTGLTHSSLGQLIRQGELI